MANWYVSSVSYAAVTAWSAGGVMTVGTLRRPTAPAVGNERVFRCTTAGTGNVSGGAEPAWPLTKGSTVADNGGVWTEVTGNETYQGPVSSAWTAPHARLENAYSWAAYFDTVFVSSSHSQTQASAWSPAICLNTIGVTETTVPPTDANLATGAVIATSGDNGMAPTVNGYFSIPYTYGIKFRTGVGASSGTNSVLNLASTPHDATIYEKCDFEHASTASIAAGAIVLAANGANWVSLIDSTVQVGNVGSSVSLGGASIRGSARATFVQGATVPTIVFLGNGGPAVFDGVDFSNVTTTLIDEPTAYAGGQTTFRNCKLNAGVTLWGGTMQGRISTIDFLNCDSTSTTRHERYTLYGSNVKSSIVVRTGGAVENTLPISWKVTGSSAASFNLSFNHWIFPIAIYNSTVGSSVNVTIEGIADPASFSALPKNDEVWFDIGYNSDAGGSGLQTIVRGSKAGVLATGAALTASTQAWDSAATARANSTTYNVGDIRKVSSNAGRLFVCTTGGLSNGSLPVAYASAVDGGTVSDGAAFFKAMWRFKYTLAVTPQQMGYINVYPYMAKASAVVYVDPLITLS